MSDSKISVISVACAYPTFASAFKQFFPGLVVLEKPADASKFDLIIFTGGEDIDPDRYAAKEDKHLACQVNSKRDEFEFAAFEAANKAGKHIFGSCRGLQLINVALGGALFPDLTAAKRQHAGDHGLKWQRESKKLQAIFTSGVNSMHHQGISRLGRGLVTYATHNEVPEIIVGKNIMAVQFHPEWMGPAYGNAGKALFQFFTDWVTFVEEEAPKVAVATA